VGERARLEEGAWGRNLLKVSPPLARDLVQAAASRRAKMKADHFLRILLPVRD
jgi:hypothetical protein